MPANDVHIQLLLLESGFVYTVRCDNCKVRVQCVVLGDFFVIVTTRHLRK